MFASKVVDSGDALGGSAAASADSTALTEQAVRQPLARESLQYSHLSATLMSACITFPPCCIILGLSPSPSSGHL